MIDHLTCNDTAPTAGRVHEMRIAVTLAIAVKHAQRPFSNAPRLCEGPYGVALSPNHTSHDCPQPFLDGKVNFHESSLLMAS